LYGRVTIDLQSDHLIARLHLQVGQLDLEEVGGILHVQEVLPVQAEGDPRREHRQ